MGRNEATMLRMVDHVEFMGILAKENAVAAVVEELQEATPVDKRHAKASYTVELGALASGFPQKSNAKSHSVPAARGLAIAGMSGGDIGDDVAVGNVAGHSAIIAGGRRPDSNGRMIGSEQAPDPYIPKSISKAIAKTKNQRVDR